MPDLEETQARWASQELRQAEADTRNKTVILNALEALGIAQVTIAFDGCGDSGQIDDVSITGGTETLSGNVTIQTASYDGTAHAEGRTLAEAVEDYCYSVLSNRYGSWGDNDGAFGTFVFDVLTRQIHLEFNSRYTDYSTDTHTEEA